jgi:hypothetical protein
MQMSHDGEPVYDTNAGKHGCICIDTFFCLYDNTAIR